MASASQTRATSPSLRVRAMWLGASGAIITMVTALNLIPLQKIGYVVSAHAIVSPQRLLPLQQKQSKDPHPQSVDQLIEWMGEGSEDHFRFLGLQAVQPAADASDLRSGLRSIRVVCFSPVQPDRDSLLAFVDAISIPVNRVPQETEVDKELRWTKWNAESTRQLLANLRAERGSNIASVSPKADSAFEMLANSSSDSSEDNRVGAEPGADNGNDQSDAPLLVLGAPKANEGDNSTLESKDSSSNEPSVEDGPFQLTSHSIAPDSEMDSIALESSLVEKLAGYDSTIERLERTVSLARNNAKGVVALSGSWQTRPVAGRIELGQALGLLTLGFTSWIAVAWLYLWLARRGGANPIDVIAWLERSGIPYLGSTEQLEPGKYMTAEKETKGSLFMNSAFEWALLGLALWIALRFAIDNQWRLLLLEQPLCGLGQLFHRMSS